MIDVRVARSIEEKYDDLVELAEQCVEETKIYGRICFDKKCQEWTIRDKCPKCGKRTREIMEESQLRNLQNLANATNSVKALENFIWYQMGRHKEWCYNDFGKKLLEDIEKLRKWAKDIGIKIGRSHDEKEIYKIHLELIRLYLGFLVRAFYAKKRLEVKEI